MTTQKYKAAGDNMALWAFSILCLAITTDVLQRSKCDAILAQITGAVRPKRDFTYFVWCERRWEKIVNLHLIKAMVASTIWEEHRLCSCRGISLNGPIHFVSNVCLELQEGATLKFSSEPAFLSPSGGKTSWEGTFLQNYSPFIYGYQLEMFQLIGKGVIDGNAGTTFATWKSKQKIAESLVEMNCVMPVAERNFG